MSKRDRAWIDYSERFRKEGLPRLLSSAVTIHVYEGGTDFDVQQAAELGAILLLDKPIILLAIPGVRLPSRLAKAADMIIEDWNPGNDEMQDRLIAALRGFDTQEES